MKLVECVPNFSEGRREGVIEAIASAASHIAGVTILDRENDRSHNRMVLTFVGEPLVVKEAALACAAEAVKSIDLTKHKGEHPRMGAVDVVPFVPLRDVSMEECVFLANDFAKTFSERFAVPVFLYEAAATRPERKDLAKVREGQFEGLRELIGKDPTRTPDYGPNHIHPTAGATAVGARPILIAYNVNLRTTDVVIAKQIARQVRGRDGGLPSVKALGFELKDRSMVQVSMNLTDYKKSSMSKAFRLVSAWADQNGVEIAESEVVGLVPMDALIESAEFYLRLQNFSRNQIIENRLYDTFSKDEESKSDSELGSTTLSEFAVKVASEEPVPAGGSTSAYAAVLAASLVSMVCRLTLYRKEYEPVFDRVSSILESAGEYGSRLQELVSEDASAYSKVIEALKLPKDSEAEKEERRQRIHGALKEATEVPLETMKLSMEVFSLAREIREIGNKRALSDSETAFQLSKAAVLGAWSNVKINLEGLKDEIEFVEKVRITSDQILNQVNPS